MELQDLPDLTVGFAATKKAADPLGVGGGKWCENDNMVVLVMMCNFQGNVVVLQHDDSRVLQISWSMLTITHIGYPAGPVAWIDCDLWISGHGQWHVPWWHVPWLSWPWMLSGSSQAMMICGIIVRALVTQQPRPVEMYDKNYGNDTRVYSINHGKHEGIASVKSSFHFMNCLLDVSVHRFHFFVLFRNSWILGVWNVTWAPWSYQWLKWAEKKPPLNSVGKCRCHDKVGVNGRRQGWVELNAATFPSQPKNENEKTWA